MVPHDIKPKPKPILPQLKHQRGHKGLSVVVVLHYTVQWNLFYYRNIFHL
jgi:hypothetical protein